MDTLLIVGLAVLVLFIAANLFSRQPQPHIIYVQTTPVEPTGGGAGCLLLLILAAIILFAISL